MAGRRSQTTLSETRMGTDSRAPGTPQSQVQKIKETKMTTGLSVNRRPSSTGVIRFASSKWSSKYQAGGRSSLPQRFKSEQTNPGQHRDSGDGTKVGNKIQHRHNDGPHRRVGHPQAAQTHAHEQTQTHVDQRNGKQIIGNVLLNLVADFHRALLVPHCGHHPNQFLQEQVARREQQIEQGSGSLDFASRQQSPGPVDQPAGDVAGFDFDDGGFFPFIVRRAQVVHGRRRLVEAGHGRENP